MPFVEDKSPDARLYEAPLPQKQDDPTGGQTWGAAFEAENDVLNAWTYFQRPKFTKQEGFDAVKHAQATRPDLWDSQRDNLMFTESEDEFNFEVQKIDRENKNRDTLERSGWAGTGAAIVAGTLSPTLFIPGLTQARGLKGVVQAAGLGLAGGVAQEIPLQMAQDTRTLEESVFSIAASTVMGGILGTAAHALRGGEREVLEDGLKRGGMDATIYEDTIPAGDPAFRTKAAPEPRRQSIDPTSYRGERSAAVQIGGEVFVGARHADALEKAIVQFGEDSPQIRAFEDDPMPSLGLIYPIGNKTESGMLREGFHGNISGGTAEDIAAAVAEIRARPDPDEQILTLRAERAEVVADPARRAEVAEIDQRITKLEEEVAARRPVEEAVEDANLPPAQTEVAAQSGGAAATRAADPGRLRTRSARGVARVLGSNFVTRSPVLHNLLNTTGVGRWTMAQLADGGLGFEGAVHGVPTTPGGTVENRVGAIWYSKAAEARDVLYDLYAKYRLDTTSPGMVDRLQARYLGMSAKDGKLSRKEFHMEVTRAMWSQDTHAIPQVQEAAQALRKNFFDPIREAAQAAGILGEDLPKFVDESWMTHNWDRNLIERRPEAFISRLAKHYEETLNAKFAKQLEKFNARQAKDVGLAEDLARPLEEVEALRTQFLDRERELAEHEEFEELNVLEDTISDIKATARSLPFAQDRQRMLADARAMEEANEARLTPFRAERAAVRQRIRNLNRSAARMEARQGDKLEKAAKSEEIQVNSLRTVARAGRRVLNKLDQWSDEVLDKELANLSGRFERSADVWERGEQRLNRMLASDEEGDMRPLFDLEELQQGRMERTTNLAERIADARDLGRGALRELIEDELDQVLQKTQRLNSRRAVRAQRLLDQARALDPAHARKHLDLVTERLRTRRTEFLDDLRLAGADTSPIATRGHSLEGSANFAAFARESASETKARIVGTYVRMPVMEVMEGKRGMQLLRTLDVKGIEFDDFMNTDMEDLIRVTSRTMGPDIELAKKFGDATASKYIGTFDEGGARQGGDLWAEMNRKLEEANRDIELSPAQREKKSQEIHDEYRALARNLEAVIGRLRHKWGVPANPDSAGLRLANTVMNLNVLRYMNMVTISSIPDIGRLVMRHGLVNTFREAVIPMITNLKEMKALKQEMKWANVGLDAVHGMRAQSLLDTFDEAQLGKRTKAEKLIEYATAKQGVVAAFSIWTDVMKRFSAAATNAKLMDSIAAVAQGKGDAKMLTYLGDNGIGGREAAMIWQEVLDNGGGARVNGVWLPQTERWRNADAVNAYRTALHRETNLTIVTPGVDKPLWTDETLMGRMLAQFKGYSFASTSRVMMAGMQQRDMAVVNGVAISLGLGMFSYYLAANITGGRQRAEMQKAGPGRWADEAIDRSGVLGVFGIGRDLLSRVPGVAPLVGFGGGRSTRRGGDSLVEAALGPSFDFGKGVSEVISGIHDPTDHTIHEARKLSPYQSIIGYRELLDMIDPVARGE